MRLARVNNTRILGVKYAFQVSLHPLIVPSSLRLPARSGHWCLRRRACKKRRGGDDPGTEAGGDSDPGTKAGGETDARDVYAGDNPGIGADADADVGDDLET